MKVYVCFDGYNDFHHFYTMKSWERDHRMGFKFIHGQDLNIRDAGKSEVAIKTQLRKQIQTVDVFVILIGESTRYLSQFLQWEMEIALAEDKPIIVVNLNSLRFQDVERCPPILRDALAVHISFHAVILQEAILNWPNLHTSFRKQRRSGPHYYAENYYSALGL